MPRGGEYPLIAPLIGCPFFILDCHLGAAEQAGDRSCPEELRSEGVGQNGPNFITTRTFFAAALLKYGDWLQVAHWE